MHNIVYSIGPWWSTGYHDPPLGNSYTVAQTVANEFLVKKWLKMQFKEPTRCP